jgi:glycosyltransferase involved in cell wall biosynthesis
MEARPMTKPLVSILINNYNYARFLSAAIDSALRQQYLPIEVIVVDDGSSDSSREIISNYGERVIPIFKDNGGQASAFNAGVAASRGEILCFLDADDFFDSAKVGRVVEEFREHGVNSKPMMVHHLLTLVNDKGDEIEGEPRGKTHASPMNLYAFAKRYGFVWYEAGPTTTISINRRLADMLFPLPEEGIRISADDFIVFGGSLLGDIYSMKDILGGYRTHGDNRWYRSGKRKSEAFLRVLQDYLNDRLVVNGLSPVISFENSIYAWSGLVTDRRWLKLGGHMLRLSVKQRDLYTAQFIYYTLMTIGMLCMKTLQARWLRGS